MEEFEEFLDVLLHQKDGLVCGSCDDKIEIHNILLICHKQQ